MWRVLIVDDHIRKQDALIATLERDKRISFPYDVVDGEGALYILDQPAQIDLVILNIRMPVMNGMETMRLIKQRCPEMKVFVWTTFSEAVYQDMHHQIDQQSTSMHDQVCQMLDDPVNVEKQRQHDVEKGFYTKVF